MIPMRKNKSRQKTNSATTERKKNPAFQPHICFFLSPYHKETFGVVELLGQAVARLLGSVSLYKEYIWSEKENI